MELFKDLWKYFQQRKKWWLLPIILLLLLIGFLVVLSGNPALQPFIYSIF